MSKENESGTMGLQLQYQNYECQKCFIAYTEQAPWVEDLLSACQEVLSRTEFNLEPDHARQHFAPDVPLRQKALELIANARYGIYDLSFWQDDKGEWHMPRNVFIEMGMAIALNRPMLLLRHASNRDLALPEFLQSIQRRILQFSGETTLKRVLSERLPQWLDRPPEQDWWNRYCTFGGRVCEYREAHPRSKQWGQHKLNCHISDGPDIDHLDFRWIVEQVLEGFNDVRFDYLNAQPLVDGYNFMICSYCQTVRSSPFAIYRITPYTSAETFIAIGMSLVLENQFDYKIPKILLTEDKQYIPSLLEGYEVIVARSDKERKQQLRTFLPMVMQKARSITWKPRPLPFVEISLIEGSELGLKSTSPVVESSQIPGYATGALDIPIEELELTVGAYNVLKRADITQVGEIIEKLKRGPHELLAIRGLGQKSLDELIDRLEVKGFLDDINDELEEDDLSNQLYEDDHLTIDLAQHQVLVQQEPVKLTPTEYRLLSYLFVNAGQVLTFEQILDNVWGWERQTSVDYVHVYISYLRRKLEEDPKQPKYLVTEFGLGYRFEKQD